MSDYEYDDEEEFVDLSGLDADFSGGLFKPLENKKPVRY